MRYLSKDWLALSKRLLAVAEILKQGVSKRSPYSGGIRQIWPSWFAWYHVKCEIALSGRTIVAKINVHTKKMFKEIVSTYLCKIEIHGIWYFYHPTTDIKCTDAIQKFSNFPLLWQNICTYCTRGNLKTMYNLFIQQVTNKHEMASNFFQLQILMLQIR